MLPHLLQYYELLIRSAPASTVLTQVSHHSHSAQWNGEKRLKKTDDLVYFLAGLLLVYFSLKCTLRYNLAELSQVLAEPLCRVILL